MWILYAFGSALFAGLTAILAKCGIQKTDSDVATAIRTIVVLAFAWLMVALVGSAPTITQLSAQTWVFLVLSGLATGASWLCYYRALQDGLASVVVPIDKLSILVSIAFSFVVFKEHLTRKAAGGLALIVAGTMFMLV
jgi:bacterial/archaeal transporter family protein